MTEEQAGDMGAQEEVESQTPDAMEEQQDEAMEDAEMESRQGEAPESEETEAEEEVQTPLEPSAEVAEEEDPGEERTEAVEGAPQMTLATEENIDELSEPVAEDTAMESGEPDVGTEADPLAVAAAMIDQADAAAEAEEEGSETPEAQQEADSEEVEAELEESEAEPQMAEEIESAKSSEIAAEADVEVVEEQDQPSEPQDGREWYVVHCYSGYENKVRHNLEQRIESMGMKDMIFDVVVPTEEEIEVKEGKRRTVERRVFPGYILVNMMLTEESWYVVRNTPGVTSFVGQGNTPLPLRPEEVSQIIKRMEADAPRIKVTFRQGERVRIVDGPFNDFHGTVSEIDMERTKVRVMVNFFGRETPVELDFLQVEKA